MGNNTPYLFSNFAGFTGEDILWVTSSFKLIDLYRDLPRALVTTKRLWAKFNVACELLGAQTLLVRKRLTQWPDVRKLLNTFYIYIYHACCISTNCPFISLPFLDQRTCTAMDSNG